VLGACDALAFAAEIHPEVFNQQDLGKSSLLFTI
jgi:hypothetical protein